MPTVLRQDGFNFVIYPDDHEPSRVHVKKAGKEVVINLGDENTKPCERENRGMSVQNRRNALQLAAEYQDELLDQWRIHSNA